MKILQIAPRMPYPLTDGGAVGIFKATEAVAKAGIDITFVTFPENDRSVTQQGLGALSEFATVHLCSKPLPSRASTLARTMFRGAYPVERRMMPEMFDLLRSLVENNTYDLVHVDHAHMGKYALWLKAQYGLPYMLREHNFESLIYERFAQVQRNPAKRFIATLHGERLKDQEIEFIRNASHVAAITQDDLRLMMPHAPDQDYSVIPAGVDTDYFHPSTNQVEDGLVLWVGGMFWDPNAEAVSYFLHDIWPKIRAVYPSSRFELVGEGTDKLSIPVSAGDSVKGHGRVPDIRPYLSRASVLVVPLRIGGGMRLKILDFFSAGKAVVSTSVGAEGNMARDEEHLLLADDPESFARSVVHVLTNVQQREILGQNGRILVENEYSWKKIGQDFVSLYRHMLTRKSAPIPTIREL